MTTRQLLGRVLLTLAALIGGVIPMMVDLGPSHVFNPLWPPHARLHEVWLLSTGGAIALIALYFLWAARQEARSLGTGAILLASLLGGFFVALATMGRYGGAVTDAAVVATAPNQGYFLGMSLNVVIFGLALIFIALGYLIARSGEPRQDAGR